MNRILNIILALVITFAFGYPIYIIIADIIRMIFGG